LAKDLNAAIAEAEAKIAKLREKARKAEARQKIIIGGAVLSEAERDPKARTWLADLLDKQVTRDTDRAAILKLIEELKVQKSET
jgi:hypothetical protein